ncbi:MAG: ScyD/ScyE family protein [Propionibacteriaceae bacterium]
MRKKMLVAAVASSALVLTAPLPAAAGGHHGAPKVTVVNQSVLMPYSLAVSKKGLFVADGATSQVSRVVGSSLKLVSEGPQPGEVAGLDLSKSGRYLAYTYQSYTDGASGLKIVGPRGSSVTADLSTYEQTVNPDRKVHYGVDNPTQCQIDAFASIPDGPPATYTGIVESHPYAVASYGNKWIVADAAGNDLLKVDRKGRISTLAVLPRQPLKITAAIAGGLGLPDCVVGVTYNFESVPTDVEVGRDGWLYVSALAGGPEDPSFGARSKVYRVNPWTGQAKAIGTGIAGATNLALKDGKIYVTEFYTGKISVLKNGKPKPYVELPGALSVEAAKEGLWAGTTVFGPNGPAGSIVKITSRH